MGYNGGNRKLRGSMISKSSYKRGNRFFWNILFASMATSVLAADGISNACKDETKVSKKENTEKKTYSAKKNIVNGFIATIVLSIIPYLFWSHWWMFFAYGLFSIVYLFVSILAYPLANDNNKKSYSRIMDYTSLGSWFTNSILILLPCLYPLITMTNWGYNLFYILFEAHELYEGGIFVSLMVMLNILIWLTTNICVIKEFKKDVEDKIKNGLRYNILSVLKGVLMSLVFYILAYVAFISYANIMAHNTLTERLHEIETSKWSY